MVTESPAQSVPTLLPWEPLRLLRKVSEREAGLSRGFLRCRPERWFPGVAARWLPLAHTSGAEIRLIEVKPVIAPLPKGASSFWGSIDGESVAMVIDAESAAVVVDMVAPESRSVARKLILEYIARRLFSGLAAAWSGPISSVFRFEAAVGAETSPQEIIDSGGGMVKVSLLINGKPAVWWMCLGPRFVLKLDGLWRRQLYSTSRVVVDEGAMHLEIAQLAVPPTLLEDYLQSGTIIDLEAPVSDRVTIRVGSKPWCNGRMCNVSGRLGVEVLPPPVSVPGAPEGTTRIYIEFDTYSVDSSAMAELAQPGAILDTGRVLTDRVFLVIDGQKVKNATLQIYEGRFAMTVG